MGVLSKYFEGSRSLKDITLTEAAYSAAALSFLGGVVYPKWLSYKRSVKKKKETSHTSSTANQPSKGPAVNRKFFEQLRKLIKVSTNDSSHDCECV